MKRVLRKLVDISQNVFLSECSSYKSLDRGCRTESFSALYNWADNS